MYGRMSGMKHGKHDETGAENAAGDGEAPGELEENGGKQCRRRRGNGCGYRQKA